MVLTSGTKGLIIHKEKLLLILRDNKPSIPFPNTWEYIGGAKNEKETLAQAGLREIEEEIGVKPNNYFYLGYESYPGRKAGRFITILTDDEFNKIHLGNEGQKYDFFTLEETLNLDMAPNLKNFLQNNKTILKKIMSKGLPVNINKKEFILTKE